MSEQELLFAAFLAGFEASREGFNGEYVGERYRGKNGAEAPALLERLRPVFEQWWAEGEGHA